MFEQIMKVIFLGFYNKQPQEGFLNIESLQLGVGAALVIRPFFLQCNKPSRLAL